MAALIDTTLSAGEFMRLRCGDVIALDHPVGQPLDVRVNGKTKYRAQPQTHARGAALDIEDVVTVAVGV